MSADKINHFDSINGLKSFSAIGIVMMHMKANNVFEISGFFYNNVISLFANFVYIFMIISAFGICCGYYEKLSSGQISLTTFYEKRYAKIFPFFSLLILLDLISGFSTKSLIEAFADMTLVFGLLPNAAISVIGVGWFLGVVFVFYMMFPFFCFCMKSKRRAWFSFSIAIIYNLLCTVYFFDDSHIIQDLGGSRNFIFNALFFMAGCLIYMYRKQILCLNKQNRVCAFIICILLWIGYFVLHIELNKYLRYIYMMMMFSNLVIFTMGSKSKILNNSVTKFISGISMEIYLSHMFIFRIVEKLKLNYLFGIGAVSYFVTVILVLAGSIIFGLMAHFAIDKVKQQVTITKNKYL